MSNVATQQRTIVDQAATALRLFGEHVDRNAAAVLLSMWSRCAELSPADRLAVLDIFGPPAAAYEVEKQRITPLLAASPRIGGRR